MRRTVPAAAWLAGRLWSPAGRSLRTAEAPPPSGQEQRHSPPPAAPGPAGGGVRFQPWSRRGERHVEDWTCRRSDPRSGPGNVALSDFGRHLGRRAVQATITAGTAVIVDCCYWSSRRLAEVTDDARPIPTGVRPAGASLPTVANRRRPQPVDTIPALELDPPGRLAGATIDRGRLFHRPSGRRHVLSYDRGEIISPDSAVRSRCRSPGLIRVRSWRRARERSSRTSSVQTATDPGGLSAQPAFSCDA